MINEITAPERGYRVVKLSLGFKVLHVQFTSLLGRSHAEPCHIAARPTRTEADSEGHSSARFDARCQQVRMGLNEQFQDEKASLQQQVSAGRVDDRANRGDGDDGDDG